MILNLNILFFEYKYSNKLINLHKKLLDSKFDEINKLLEENEIKYIFYNIDLTSLNKIDKDIKNNIINGKKSFLIDKKNYYLFGIIEKKIKKDIGIKYSFFQIKSIANNNDLKNELIQCSNIEKIKSDNKFEVLEYKKMELDKLNINIFEKFEKENDTYFFEINDTDFLILLCQINYNIELAESILFDEKIKKIVNEIENEFILTKKKEYNFKAFNQINE